MGKTKTGALVLVVLNTRDALQRACPEELFAESVTVKGERALLTLILVSCALLRLFLRRTLNLGARGLVVGVPVGVSVSRGGGVDVRVGLGVAVKVGLGVEVGVLTGVCVAVGVAEGVGVGSGSLASQSSMEARTA